MIAFTIPNVADPAPPPALAADLAHDGAGGVEFRLNGFPVFGVGADGRGVLFAVPALASELDLDAGGVINVDLV